MCAVHVCVKDYSFQSEEGILLNVLFFCFRYDSVCQSVYTVMTLRNTRSAANRSVLKLKDGKQTFSNAERLDDVCVIKYHIWC